MSRLAGKPVPVFIVLMISLAGILSITSNIQTAKAEPKTIVVPDQYPTINEAIAHANDGDTVYVRAGIYYEKVRVDTQVTLIGEDPRTTIVDANRVNTPIIINAPFCTVTGFTFRRSQLTESMFEPCFGGPFGVLLSYGCNFTGNIVIDNGLGVYSWWGDCNIVSRNNITFNSVGVCLRPGHGNTIQGNNIVNNSGSGISLAESSDNTVIGNNISNSGWGVFVGWSSNNSILGNTITYNSVAMQLWFSCVNNSIRANRVVDNYWGMQALESSGNLICHNSFVNSTKFDLSRGHSDIWDDGYPSGGNYWSDYDGADLNRDGIGDTPYVIDAWNVDDYPLIAPCFSFDAGTWDSTPYQVGVISNSTVSEFRFSPEKGPFIRFTVTGENGTIGFCRVAIPRQLLWTTTTWVVLVNRRAIDCRVIADENHTYLCFFYQHSMKTVEIWGTYSIPEFVLNLLLPLSMILSALAAICIRKRIVPFRTEIRARCSLNPKSLLVFLQVIHVWEPVLSLFLSSCLA